MKYQKPWRYRRDRDRYKGCRIQAQFFAASVHYLELNTQAEQKSLETQVINQITIFEINF
jgi:hypothetical protein